MYLDHLIEQLSDLDYILWLQIRELFQYIPDYTWSASLILLGLFIMERRKSQG
jgi:hypothetical protein